MSITIISKKSKKEKNRRNRKIKESMKAQMRKIFNTPKRLQKG